MSAKEIGLESIEAKLDTVIRLLAIEIASENSSLADRATRLQRAGLQPKDIAALCGTTPHTVSVELSAAKKKRSSKS